MANTPEKTKSDGTITIDDECDYASVVTAAASHLQHVYTQALALYASDLSCVERAIARITIAHDTQMIDSLCKIEYEVDTFAGVKLFKVSYYCVERVEDVPVKTTTYLIHNLPSHDLDEVPSDAEGVDFKTRENDPGTRYLRLTRKDYLQNPVQTLRKVIYYALEESTFTDGLSKTSVSAANDAESFVATAFALGCYASHFRKITVKTEKGDTDARIYFLVQSCESDTQMSLLRTSNYYNF